MARRHRGSLSESMTTVVEIRNFDALIDIIRSDFGWFAHPLAVDKDTVHVSPYGSGMDTRIGWNTYIVTVDLFGVWGFTNGPLEGAPRE